MTDVSNFPAVEVQTVKRVMPLLKPVLDKFTSQGSILESFWAALTINETGIFIKNNLKVPKRFEPAVYKGFQGVLAGKIPEYENFHHTDLVQLPDEGIRELASSHGLTQVMGYHAVNLGHVISELDTPETHYLIASKLMAMFVARYYLDPQADFGDMFTCWNTGRPDGKTYDPNYAANGILRKTLWEVLSQ